MSGAAGIDSPVEKYLPAMHKVQSSIPGTSDNSVDSNPAHLTPLALVMEEVCY